MSLADARGWVARGINKTLKAVTTAHQAHGKHEGRAGRPKPAQ